MPTATLSEYKLSEKELPMSMLASTYSAFIESVCNQFDCRRAIPALKEGFTAFCEASGMDPEYMVLYRGFNGKHAHEGTIYNRLGCPNNALWASPYQQI